MSVENLKKFALKLGQTENFIVSATMDIIESDKVSDRAKELNINQMVKDGVGSDNVPLGQYAPLSVEIRDGAGLQTDYVDLHFSGDFQESIYTMSSKAGDKTPAIIFEAKDYKWREAVSGNREKGDLKSLQQLYPKALGLNEASAEEIGGVIAPLLAQAISKFWKI